MGLPTRRVKNNGIDTDPEEIFALFCLALEVVEVDG